VRETHDAVDAPEAHGEGVRAHGLLQHLSGAADAGRRKAEARVGGKLGDAEAPSDAAITYGQRVVRDAEASHGGG